MTYVTQIPVTGDSLGGTRDRVRTNFVQIAAVEAVNHVAFNALGEGKHKFLQMPEQAAAPTTAADEGGFYAKVGTSPAQSNLFFRGESNGFEYQLTRAISASTVSFSTITQALGLANGFGGWTFLPGNLLIQYGYFDPIISTTVQFPIPFTSTPFSVQLTVSAATNSTFRVGIETGSLTNSQFVFQGTVSPAANPIYFIAIGK